MMRVTNKLCGGMVVLATALVLPGSVLAETWDLAGVQSVDLRGASGDIEIRQGGGTLELHSDVEPADTFHADVERSGSTLRIEEQWGHGHSTGRVLWKFYVPGDIHLKIRTASGDLDARDVNLEIEFKTASGDIILDGVGLGQDSGVSTASGDIKLTKMTVEKGIRFSTASGNVVLVEVVAGEGASFSTASGDVEARRVSGSVRLNSASGNVVARDCSFRGPGKFASASGDVSLDLDVVPLDGITASSASGDVILNAGRLGGGYTLILVADKEKGRIRSPFKDYTERTIQRNGREYIERRVDVGPGGPTIELSTASGAVVVRG